MAPGFSPSERRLLAALRTPTGVPRALDEMPYHLLLDLEAVKDTDHVLAIYRERGHYSRPVNLARFDRPRPGRVDRRSLAAGLVGFRKK